MVKGLDSYVQPVVQCRATTLECPYESVYWSRFQVD